VSVSLFNMGLPIIVSEVALETTDQRLFPASKNRSRRIHKKLVKRFGGESRKVPTIFRTPQGLICHPVMYAKLRQALPL
jgi:hypothetical protein